MPDRLIAVAPVLVETTQDLPFPMPFISYLATASLLAAGGASDIVCSLATDTPILAQAGIGEGERYTLAGILLAGFCFVSQRLLSYHQDRVKGLVDENQRLIAKINEMQREKDADFRRQLEEAKDK